MKRPAIIVLQFYILLSQLLPFKAQGQGCTACVSPFSSDTLLIQVNTTDSSSYTIGAGKTLCIYSGARFTGTLTVNGGTVCNKGYFSPRSLNFSSGSIYNKSKVVLPGLALGSGRSLYNTARSLLTVEGSLTLSGGSVTNDGILNITETLQNNSGSLLNRSVLNCKQLSGSNALTNLGILNSN